MKLLPLLFLAACVVPVTVTPEQPSMTEQASSATYQMFTPDRAQCTAWAVDDHHVISAGHCCDEEGTYTLIGEHFKTVYATVVAYQDEDFDDGPPVDVCLLQSTESVGPGIPLAKELPEPGDTVGFVGYPLGKRTVSTGEYVGDVDGPFQFYDDYTATAPCDHGASGSAMYSAAGVYGVLVRLVIVGDQVLPGSQGCVASPLEQILGLLNGV